MIGDKSHKVLRHQVVTKNDDPVTQRHEKLGTVKILNEFEEKSITIDIWIHDRNVSINKELSARDIMNQNDLWHGIKGLKKALQKIAAGPKKHHGKTWHNELFDKVTSVANHAHYAARNSNGDPALLQQMLLNTVQHYKGNHDQCQTISRCKTDPNFELSKKLITDSSAESLLSKTIQSSTLFKSAKDFSYGKDSHYVESYNNVLNIFTDKRIAFSSEEYELRVRLATLHWNENVDRGFTSEWQAPSAANRRSKIKKIYKKLSYDYHNEIWECFLMTINRA